MEDETRIIGSLNSLIEVNDRRMRLYQFLASRMEHSELKSLFGRYEEQSKQFLSELSIWRSAYGGFRMPEKKGISSIWTQAEQVWDHWFRKNVASKCDAMERDALKVYRTVLQRSHLPHVLVADIERQSREFEKALAKLTALREQGVGNVKVREEFVHTVVY